MEKKADILINFFIRAVVGATLIFFINEFLMSKGIESNVGMNLVNAAVSGIFGVPGVVMLYGIGFY